MSGGFSNPIVGGGGALVYPSIHSPNFSEGPPITGWSIDKNGDVYIAGNFAGKNYEINSHGAFFYSGTPALGNLVLSSANNAGTDRVGNAYLQGDVSYGNNGSEWVASQNYLGGFAFYTATSEAGPWTPQGALAIGVNNPTYVQLQGGNPTGAAFISPAGRIIGQNGVAALGTPEVWHAVSIPANWTGSARVKMLAESSFAVFDINITAPVAGATSGTFGLFPSSAYNPLSGHIFPMGYTGNVQGTNPRLIVPAGAAAANFGGLPAGFTGSVTMTVIYPLD